MSNKFISHFEIGIVIDYLQPDGSRENKWKEMWTGLNIGKTNGPGLRSTYKVVINHKTTVAPARGARGEQLPPPMLKKMALITLPNSMRKLGGGWLSISDVKKSE